MKTGKTMEVCVENIQSALHAYNGGGKRIELCQCLHTGGLTPTLGTFLVIKNLIKIPIFVMIRPRPGVDYMYSTDEVEIMKQDIKLFKQYGADGFVFGVLTDNKKVDTYVCEMLLKITKPLPVTFHRAFDLVNEPFVELETIIELGFSRILTSGLKDNAEEGIDVIKQLIKKSNGRIIIMPGSGVTDQNLCKILKTTNAQEFHGTAKKRGTTDVILTDIKLVKKMVEIGNTCKKI